MAVVSQDFVGNRVFNGTHWMQFYYYYELDGITLTSTGKIPNNYVGEVVCRLKIEIRFDIIVNDGNNTYTFSGSWPNYTGPKTLTNNTHFLLSNEVVRRTPMFGAGINLSASGSLTGIGEVPGTASYNLSLTCPAKAWAAPEIPVITGYEISSVDSSVTITISGNQTDISLDKYWETIEYKLLKNGSLESQSAVTGNQTQIVFANLASNTKYEALVRSANSDAGPSVGWSNYLTIYTKPSAPSTIQAKRKTTDPTKIDITWSINAAYPGFHYIERRTTPAGSWSQIGTSTSSDTSYTDTYATGTTPEYRVRTITPDSKTYSDYSGIVMADSGAIKQFIPGVNEIYHGSTKVTKVYFQNKMIWQS